MMRRAKHVENKRCSAQRKKTRLWSRRDGDCVVYMHRNRRNNKIYVGYTKRSCFERWTYNEYKKRGCNNYFYNALIKEKELYEAAGIQSNDRFIGFESQILIAGLSAEDAPEVEKVTIAFLKDKGVELYNRTDGGEVPPIVRLVGEDNPAKRPEVRRKLSENNPMKRPEVAAKHKEAVNRPERCRKISEALKGNHNGSRKPVEAINPETGERVYYFTSTREAERAGFDRKSISECCRKKRKMCRGLFWRFVKPEPDQTE